MSIEGVFFGLTVGAIYYVYRTLSVSLLELKKTITQQQHTIDDLKRELEELKRKE